MLKLGVWAQQNLTSATILGIEWSIFLGLKKTYQEILEESDPGVKSTGNREHGELDWEHGKDDTVIGR